MPQNPSWKWLSSRSTASELAAQAAASKSPSRPCLPAVEQLDQRVMLSVAGDIIVEPPQPADSTQILIGLVKGELDLVKEELNFLRLAAAEQKFAETPNLIHKLTQSFLKIDDVLYRYGEDLIKGGLDGVKLEIAEKKAISEIDSQFSKIGGLLGEVGEGGFTRLIEGIKQEATSILIGLGDLGPGGELDSKDQHSLLNFASKFEVAADAILNLEGFNLARKAGGKQIEYIQVKLEDILVSASKVSLEYKDQIKPEGIIAILIGLLSPAEKPTDGVSIVTTDDVILG
jgi:hypothetical protein